ncbi:helix-turn-helix domain-containing protein [Microbacterium sp. NPDC055988]|uniref:helix-turn-helix domain-containing protein n=1 Tax=Microbacterium sp. NPDC055988 TaxID=3345671 RepID=UPI0035DED36F
MAHHNDVQKLAEQLLQIRTARGLSQEQVAHAANLSTYTYSCLERGVSPSGGPANPTLETLLRTFDALQIVPPSLIDDRPDAAPPFAPSWALPL